MADLRNGGPPEWRTQIVTTMPVINCDHKHVWHRLPVKCGRAFADVRRVNAEKHCGDY